MKIVADYKKRKELKEYLPHEEHWKLRSDRKSVGEKPGAKDQSPAILAPLSPNSAASLAGDTASKLSTQVGAHRTIACHLNIYFHVLDLGGEEEKHRRR